MMRSIVCARVLRVQGREHEVAGLGRGQRGRDRLEVAHLAHEDHVGVLAKGCLQAEREALCVVADLALVDHALLVAVQELDRVLDREDVLLALLVDLVDHRRQRRGLAGSGRTRHEHEATRLLHHLVDHRRQPELVDRLDLGGDQAERRADRGALHVGVDPEAPERAARSTRSRPATPPRAACAGRSKGSSRRCRGCPWTSAAGSPRARATRRARAPSAARRRSGGGPTRSARPSSFRTLRNRFPCSLSLIGSHRGTRNSCHFLDRGDAHPELVDAVLLERAHALLDRDVADLVGGGPLDRELADLLRDTSSPRRARRGPCSRRSRSACSPWPGRPRRRGGCRSRAARPARIVTGSLQCVQSRRARRCETTQSSAEAVRKGSIPISVRRTSRSARRWCAASRARGGR